MVIGDLFLVNDCQFWRFISNLSRMLKRARRIDGEECRHLNTTGEFYDNGAVTIFSPVTRFTSGLSSVANEEQALARLYVTGKNCP